MSDNTRHTALFEGTSFQVTGVREVTSSKTGRSAIELTFTATGGTLGGLVLTGHVPVDAVHTIMGDAILRALRDEIRTWEEAGRD